MKNTKRKCKTCGKLHRNKIYCSKICRRVKKTNYKCDYKKCNKILYLSSNQLKNSKKHYCSKKCNIKTQRDKRIKTKCNCCGKILYLTIFHFYDSKNHYCSTICCEMGRIGKFKGKYSPGWQDGKSFEPYTPKFNNQLKEQIRERDNHICQECGKHQSELIGRVKRLCVHHIDYDKKNCDPKNLISLCVKCHNKTNAKKYRESFTLHYQLKIEIIYSIKTLVK